MCENLPLKTNLMFKEMHFYKDVLGKCYYSDWFFCTSRPHSTDSATHRKMTLSLADRCSKTQKIRILPMAGRDPESHRNEMIKVARAVRCENSFVTTETGRVWMSRMRSAVDKHHGRLHKDTTWHAYIMWSRSGEWNGNGVGQSRVLVMRLLSAQRKTADYIVRHCAALAQNGF